MNGPDSPDQQSGYGNNAFRIDPADVELRQQLRGGGEGPPAPGRGLVTGIGLVLVALFAGGIWYAYQMGADSPQGPPKHVKADESPTKVPPTEPGGIEVPHQEKLVYERMAGQKNSKAEELLPPSEEPVKKPVAPAPAAAGNAPQPLTPQANAPTGIPGGVAPGTPLPTLETRTGVIAAAPEPKGPPGSAGPAPAMAPPPSSGVLTAPPGMKPLTPDAQAPASAPAQAPAQAQAPAPLTSAPAPTATAPAPLSPAPATVPKTVTSGGVPVQLGALKEEGQAKALWTSASRKASDLLGNVSHTIQAADVPGKGTYYRLRVGPFANRAEAKSFCDQLKARGVDCLIPPA